MPIYSNSPINIGETNNAYNVSAADSIDSGWTLEGSGTNGVVSISSAYDFGDSFSADSVGSGKYAIVLTDGSIKFNTQIPANTQITISFWSGRGNGFTGHNAPGDGHDLRLRDSANGSSGWGSVSGARWMKATSGYPASRDHVNLASSSGTIDHSEIPDDLDMAFFSVTFTPSAAMYYKIEGLADNNTSNTKMLYDLKLTTGGNIVTHGGDASIQPSGHVNFTSFSIDGYDVEASAGDLNLVSGVTTGLAMAEKAIIPDSDYRIDINQVGFTKHSGLMVSGSSNVTVNNANKFIRLIETPGKIAMFGGISRAKTTSHTQILVNFTGNEGDSTSGNFTLLINAKMTPHSTLSESNVYQAPYYDSDGTSITCKIIGSNPGFDPSTDLKMNISRSSNNVYLYASVYVKTPFSYRDVVVTHLTGGTKGYVADESPSSDNIWFTSKDQSYVAAVPEPWNGGSYVNVATISGGWEGLVVGEFDAHSPISTKLVLSGTSTGKLQLQHSDSTDQAHGAELIFRRAVQGASIVPGFNLGEMWFYASNDNINFKDAAALLVEADSTFVPGQDEAGRFVFFTTTGTTLSEKMRLTCSGSLGIGTGAPQHKLDVPAVGGLVVGATYLHNDGATNSAWTVPETIGLVSSSHKISFVAPANGMIKIRISFFCAHSNANAADDEALRVGIYSNNNNGKTGYIRDIENCIWDLVDFWSADEQDNDMQLVEGYFSGLTAGNTYEWEIHFGSSAASTHVIFYGTRYPPFIIEAVTLPNISMGQIHGSKTDWDS